MLDQTCTIRTQLHSIPPPIYKPGLRLKDLSFNLSPWQRCNRNWRLGTYAVRGIKQSCLNASMMPYRCQLMQHPSRTAATPSLTLVRLLQLLLNITTSPPAKMTLKWMRHCVYYHCNCSSFHHSNSQLYYSRRFPVAPKHPYQRPSSTIQLHQPPQINLWSLLLEQQ